VAEGNRMTSQVVPASGLDGQRTTREVSGEGRVPGACWR